MLFDNCYYREITKGDSLATKTGVIHVVPAGDYIQLKDCSKADCCRVNKTLSITNYLRRRTRRNITQYRVPCVTALDTFYSLCAES